MSDAPVFSAAIAESYERHLVPMIFEPYAYDLATRIAALAPTCVLEVAAGTGVLTRAMDAQLDASVAITATDLTPAMLARASALGASRHIDWRQADAQDLPFPDATFDVVACQFGVMFFPDKARAFSEARRVLRPDGTYIFSVWDRIEENEFAHVVEQALTSLFPDDPPQFIRRVPHGYFDTTTITRDLEMGAFTERPRIETLAAISHTDSLADAAAAYCLGTPIRNEIETRDASRLVEATVAATAMLAQRFGQRSADGKIQAKIVTIRH